MSLRKGDPQLAEIAGKLDILIRLSALNLVRGLETQREQIAVLSDAGFGPKQIGGALSTNQNAVNVTLNKIRKERAKETKEVQEATNPSGVKEEVNSVDERAK